MKEIRSTAFIDEHGKLQITHREKFAAAIAAHPNMPCEVVVEPVKNSISHKQRKYFFGVIVDLLQGFFETTGVPCDKQDVYDLLKDQFLYREKMNPISNRYVKVPMSLSDHEAAMNRAEFTEKKEAIQQWAAEKFDLEIPDPDPHWRMYKSDVGQVK